MKHLKLSVQKPEHGATLTAMDWINIKNWLKFVKPGRWIKISYSVVYHLRSTDQNAWYWTQCTAFADDFGWNAPKEVHEHFKKQFLTIYYTLPNGFRCSTIGSTTDLSTVEFMEYVDKCRVYAFHTCNFRWKDPRPKKSDTFKWTPLK
ncbi:MAG: hypothetical protein BBJ57_07285 [Desulfobacterales bacterium PC51MH44]|nr:MAG: hypothetical protein BBJ57_07285 [Desulfobacterales bacterium PC51MH44]